jgi:hypothetical protein
MFSDLRAEIIDRFFEAERNFKATHRLTDKRAKANYKGLVFVELYGIYEQTVCGIVREAILHMRSVAIPVDSVRAELLALVLNSELQSIADAGREKLWGCRIELFKKALSGVPVDVPDTVFPSNGNQYRPDQLQLIWAIFGIMEPTVPHSSSEQTILELVGRRNAIAHGRSRPAEVGRRLSPRDVKKKIKAIQKVCLHLIDTMELHCSAVTNLQK